MGKQVIIIKVSDNGEGEDIHPELMLSDFLGNPKAYEVEMLSSQSTQDTSARVAELERAHKEAEDMSEARRKEIHRLMEDRNHYRDLYRAKSEQLTRFINKESRQDIHLCQPGCDCPENTARLLAAGGTLKTQQDNQGVPEFCCCDAVGALHFKGDLACTEKAHEVLKDE